MKMNVVLNSTRVSVLLPLTDRDYYAACNEALETLRKVYFPKGATTLTSRSGPIAEGDWVDKAGADTPGDAQHDRLVIVTGHLTERLDSESTHRLLRELEREIRSIYRRAAIATKLPKLEQRAIFIEAWDACFVGPEREG
jgi:hypothetical protein